MEKKDNLLGVLQTLFKWRKPIFYTCLAAGVGTAIISLLLPTYYKATTIFLAASPDQAKPELMFGEGELEAEFYGNENDIDRIFTIAESSELADYLIDTFDLYTHYDIDPNGAKAPYKVREAFFDLYEVTKTKRDAIELTIEDTDKVLAAKIANAARDRIDAIVQKLMKEAHSKTINAYKSSIIQKQQQLLVISDSLNHLRSAYGVYNADAQIESIMAQLYGTQAMLVRDKGKLEVLEKAPGIRRDTITFMRAKVTGMEAEVKSLEEKVKNINDGMPKISIWEKQYWDANTALGNNRVRLKQFEAAFESDIPSIILVEKAHEPLIKSRPKRSLIVIAAVVIAFFFSIAGVLLIDAYQGTNWRQVFHDR
ncbi:MAG: hypothetical protein HUU01_00035 [Saprospiraceae bacterium]|nr:hypothetical protein [Saprospiraceae bacterium]